jgi:hypothetical protein
VILLTPGEAAREEQWRTATNGCQRLRMVAVGCLTFYLMEEDDHWLWGGEPLSIDNEDNRAGGVMGVNNNSMWHPTPTAYASTSSKTMASGHWGGFLVVAFIVNSNCIVTH